MLYEAALIAFPFTGFKLAEDVEVDYDADVVDLTLKMIFISLEINQIRQKRVFIVCHHQYDEAPAGELAGALAMRDPEVMLDFVSPGSTETHRTYKVSIPEVRRIYKEVWGLDDGLVNVLHRADVMPDHLLEMTRSEILAIKGVYKVRLKKILKAQQRLLEQKKQ